MHDVFVCDFTIDLSKFMKEKCIACTMITNVVSKVMCLLSFWPWSILFMKAFIFATLQIWILKSIS